MGKSKTTKSDGVENFASFGNTQDLGNQKRIPRGSVPTGNPQAHK